jgi:hypothetical protein
MKISSIVIRCYEFDKMRSFWQEGASLCSQRTCKRRVVLRDPAGLGSNVSLD